MRLPGPFRWDDDHIAIDLGGASIRFTTRRGGVSDGPYASLNLGRWTDDDPESVARNRGRLQTSLDVRFAYARQVHGTRVMKATGPTHPPDADRGVPLAEADGQVTDKRGVAPMVLTADCLPVAIAAPGAVGMLHAGWRGLAGGVVEEGIRRLRELAPNGPVSAAIGPGAGACCFEVGEEVHERFATIPSARHGRNLDLPGIARVLLERAGAEHVHACGLCTICSEQELFFSHRRDRGVTGRQAGIAWLS